MSPFASPPECVETDARVLTAVLDEINCPMAITGFDLGVVRANHAARIHPLWRTLKPDATAPLRRERLQALSVAVRNAITRGLRSMPVVEEDGVVYNVAVVPIATTPSLALMLLSRHRLCEALSVQSFASMHGLTSAEGQVLQAMTEGLGPNQVAQQNGVCISTVRSHLSSIRSKTGTHNLRELLDQIGRLPQLVSALRTMA